MGQTGSYTAKAKITPNLLPFTKWKEKEMEEFRLRSQLQLSETFALRRTEFDFLIGLEQVDSLTLRSLFNDVFLTKGNKVVDKFEVMCVVCFASALSNAEKVAFIFDMFNFNEKGYLLEPEISVLLSSVTAGIYKADPNFVPPSPAMMQLLLKTALSFASFDKSSNRLRKPELISFAAEVPDVQYFLDAWRGHAGQILIGKGQNWRDATFPASNISICPITDWQYEGLPPEHFVEWRRPANIYSIRGRKFLFSHRTEILKTVDKRVVYEGSGCIAGGMLKQGLLSDRWFINAVAMCIARPKVVEALFANTGQEDLGRYCVRFYEGFGWRSVYVDSRIPCSHDGIPLFVRSSDQEESWPLLLEKAAAKYFSSYGHFAMAGIRADAVMHALRLLTGGHAMKIPATDFVWVSVPSDVKGGEDGALFVQGLLDEGSLVALGRSEPNAYQKAASPRVGPPFGHLFAVVGMTVIDNYKHLILRDPWGLVLPEDRGVADRVTGHCRVFLIKVEDVLKNYDTVMVSRFPDSLRLQADALRLKRWRTEVASRVTGGPSKPAIFTLRVLGHAQEVKKVSQGVARFEVQKKRTPEAEARRAAKEEKEEKAKLAKCLLEDKDAEKPLSAADKPVELAFTMTSACDWLVAGTDSAAPISRIRIIPSKETTEIITAQLKLVADHEERARQRQAARLAAEAKVRSGIKDEPAEGEGGEGNQYGGRREGAGESKDNDKDKTELADFEEKKDPSFDQSAQIIGIKSPGADSKVDKKEATLLSGLGTTADVISPNSGNDSGGAGLGPATAATDKEGDNQDCRQYELRFSEQRCWLSGNLKLFPGVYHVFADTSFKQSADQLFKARRPAYGNAEDSPWLDSVDTGSPQPLVVIQVSSAGRFELKTPDSLDTEGLEEETLISVRVMPDTWPFMCEVQSEVSSKGLVNMMAEMQDEVADLTAQFVGLFKDYEAAKSR